MKTEHEIERRIDETLNLTDSLQHVSPRPFFYTRLQAKMEKRALANSMSLIPLSIKVSCVLVVVVNIIFLTSSLLSPRNEAQNFASYYNLQSEDVYSSTN